MTKRSMTKRIFLALAALLLIVLLAGLAVISNAKVVMTTSGAYKSLRMPLGLVSLKFPIYAGTGEDVFIKGYLAGPVVRRNANDAWSASWFCQNRTLHASGHGKTLILNCAGKQQVFSLAEAAVPPAVAPMPDRLVVLSDLEGNSQFLDAALRKLGIADDAGHWQFGHGQLVVLGDSVDRGRNVFQVLWRLHDLSLQAQAAGGAVHVVLGNHDQYLLRTIVSRADDDYLYALQRLGGYHAVYAADTLLGTWLRKQPVMLKLGSVLFVHGGVSPQVAKSGLTVPEINQAMREYWREDGKNVRHAKAYDAVLGTSGVTQYRGYFYGGESDDDKDAPLVNHQDVENILTAFDARQIVVAHTLVERVQLLFGGLVYAVDVGYQAARPQVLVYEHGVPNVVNIDIHRGHDGKDVATRQREFSLFDHDDRQLVRGMIAELQREAEIPWPY